VGAERLVAGHLMGPTIQLAAQDASDAFGQLCCIIQKLQVHHTCCIRATVNVTRTKGS